MALTSGTRLGPYEILSPLGAGGMGEVYKARDTRLDRTVAIKILSDALAADPQFRERFDREARTISQLTHPHICTLYDVGHQGGTDYLVLEHLEGETLADRLARENGPLPLDLALRTAIDISDALHEAHRAGITHRDLKPANIMLTKAGVKLLDFGLAKLLEPAAAISMAGMTGIATRAPATARGTILGTVQYMAPEQVEGKDADARSDIWALGVILYEMASGARPFTGESPASVIGSILKDIPAPLTDRAPMVPAMLDRLVSRCIEKNPDDRWQSAADLHHALAWIADGVNAPVLDQRSGKSRRARVLAIAIGGLVTFAFAAIVPGWLTHLREAPPEALRLSMLPPPNTTFSSPPTSVVAPQVMISPDGRRLAFVAETPRGRPGIWIRSLDAFESKLVPGTEDASYPFWSPDARSIGFFARGKLKTIEAAGGQPKTLSDAASDARGGTWNRDGTIVFAPTSSDVLYGIAATGGPARPVTRFDVAREEKAHRFPSFLPDGRHFLYTTRSERQDNWGISIASLDSPIGTPVIERSDWSAQFAPPGRILFLRGSTLMAQPFDVARLSTTGEAVAVAESVGTTTTSYGAFSASQTGVLVYAKQMGLTGVLRWFNRAGMPLGSVAPAAEYLDFELSPDEHTVAVSRVDPEPNTADIWLLDLVRGISSRFTVDRSTDSNPMWSPDGSRIVFRSNRRGISDLYQKRASGAGTEERVLSVGSTSIPSDWSLDGRYVVFTNRLRADRATAGSDIWVWPTFGDQKPIMAVRTPFNATHGRLSPDGRWIAYASDEFGQLEVYVQAFPTTGDKKQISSDGGSEPRWRRDGNELFYLASDNKLMSVPIPGGNAFNAAVPKALFETRVPLRSAGNAYRTNYTATVDGQRFIVNTRLEDVTSPPINIVLNWAAGLKK